NATPILNTGQPPLPASPTSLTDPKTPITTPYQHYMQRMIFNNSNPVLDGVIGPSAINLISDDNNNQDEYSLPIAH
ncbi:unnamed protein product, partial [Rotaria socialis]